MGYQVELVYIKELQEIPETDENNFQIVDDSIHPMNNYSEGNNSYNRQSPVTPGGSRKMILSSRFHQRGGVGIFGTITSSNNSNDNK